jgi:hypothetical protein
VFTDDFRGTRCRIQLINAGHRLFGFVTISVKCLKERGSHAGTNRWCRESRNIFVDGLILATAFSNPLNLDLVQVVNKRGKVVWNVTPGGEVNINSDSPTANTLLRQFCEATFAQAFAENPMEYDVFQVVGPGGVRIFHVDHADAALAD